MMRQDIQAAEQEGKAIMKQTVKMANETKQLASLTLERLNDQSAQIDRITKESDDTQRIAKENTKVMKQLNRGWMRRLFCMCFTKPDYPDTTVKWHSDEDHIKSMTKKKRDKYLKDQAKSFYLHLIDCQTNNLIQSSNLNCNHY